MYGTELDRLPMAGIGAPPGGPTLNLPPPPGIPRVPLGPGKGVYDPRVNGQLVAPDALDPRPGTNSLFDQNMATPGVQARMAQLDQRRADDIHRQKTDAFLRNAIADFHRGGITRGQLAEAVGAHDAYDYKAWKEANVIHPSHASPAHNEMPPEIQAAAPPLGIAAPPPGNAGPPTGAGSL